MEVLPDRLRVLAVVPVYGHVDMTHDLVRDLGRERWLCDVTVVDNKGDYEPLGSEKVVVPDSNLGWAAGVNAGSEPASKRYGHLLWLNNDVRLSHHFVRSLVEARAVTGAGVVSSFYNCHWLHQNEPMVPSVEVYRRRRKHYRAPFVDGTCMLVSRSTVERIGLLDAETFVPLGWGAEIDYCLRARQAGHEVVVTRLAYLHHFRGVTASSVFGDFDDYVRKAYPSSVAGLERKWGAEWHRLAEIDPVASQTRRIDESSRRYPRAVPGLAAMHRASARFRSGVRAPR